MGRLSSGVILSQLGCMNKAILIVLALQLAVAGCGQHLSTWPPSFEQPVIPLPVVATKNGNGFTIEGPVVLAVRGPDKEALTPAAEAWTAERSRQLGTSFLLSSDGAEAHITITLAQEPAGDAEGYRLDSTDGRVRIEADGPAGAFYGLQTLRQLLTVDDAGRVHFPGVHVADVPRFS